MSDSTKGVIANRQTLEGGANQFVYNQNGSKSTYPQVGSYHPTKAQTAETNTVVGMNTSVATVTGSRISSRGTRADRLRSAPAL